MPRGRSRILEGGFVSGEHGKRRARAYNGGLGLCQRGPGAEPLVRDVSGKGPESESLLAFARPTGKVVPFFLLLCK